MASVGQTSLLLASPIARAVARFLRWWGNELAAVVPERLSAWWSQTGQTVFLSIDGDRVVFTRRVGSTHETVLDAIFSGNNIQAMPGTGGSGSERIHLASEQLGKLLGKDYQLVLSLAPANFLRRTLQLPLATEENLAQTLTFELDRYTPFKPEEAYFGFRILQRNPDHQTLSIDLAVAKRSHIDRQKRLVADHGLPLSGIAFDGEILGGSVPSGQEAFGSPQSSRRVWFRVASAFLSLLLLAGLLGIPIWQKRAAAIALQAPLAEARMAAKDTDALRERLDALVAEHNRLPDMKWSSPSLVQALDEISLRLKDDTFVTNFNLDGKTIVLQGESGNGAELVELLEASPLFHNVMFKSPLTKLPGGSRDRFHISADISTEGLPKAANTPGPGIKP